ncbi:Rne/Rng family ribonuclease, partial [Alphaproteobacteria bacterium]|nr:Rne/Rng family ribonuclease [Alphaproteobacteria bacterium]
ENIIEDLDFESSTKEQLRGNIYLAKISRVEPSLRAAFVDYGNNRHGFLPFNEIHPNYFQIPVSDKESLLANTILEEKKKSSDSEEEEISFNETNNLRQASIRRSKLYSKYKIQEVIKKRQILLIQVTKEERGNKGAALTTFLSLAGRYCVLMPNSANSGGVSKKIVFKTRKKMKEILNSLNTPHEMSVILRTAGSDKSKTEIKRDYDYLYKLWQDIKNKTLKSIAPILIHEENHIIKRAIRDNFSNDLQEIVIEGAEAYKLGKSFMKTLIPSKAALVKKYKNNIPIFDHYGLEKEIELIFKSEVKLRSGGSIVINPTEALVAIDVNSGKSTLERDIEPTAVKTNLEAAREIARQLRLRDLGGLIVIDFIDMNIRKNNYLVENKLKNSIKLDRAKIQVGKISPFGLLELSRQRLRPSLLEINYKECIICEGTGLVRSIESQSLQIIRSLEQLYKTLERKVIVLEISPLMAQYMLNNKYTFFDNKDKNTNTIQLLINNHFSPNKFNISTENSHNHYDKPSLEDKDKEKEKDNHKKEMGRKVSKKKFIKKATNKESKISKENKPLKQNNKNKALKLIKQKENAEKKPLNKKVKAIKKRTTSKQKKVIINEEKLDPKDIKTGWWDQ